MMLTMEETAQQWIDDELITREYQNHSDSEEPIKLQLSPARWVLPKLLRIIYQNTDQQVHVMAPLIRSMLQEQVFVTTGGDPCDCAQLEDSINETTALLITVLERVRRQCMNQPKLD